jgi:hypothetical protein
MAADCRFRRTHSGDGWQASYAYNRVFAASLVEVVPVVSSR